MNSYRELRPQKIIDTVDVLCRRIIERFSESSLARVADELHRIAQEAAVRAERIRRPNYLLRLAILALSGVVIALLVFAVRVVRVDDQILRFDDFVQTFEAALSGSVFLGAMMLFLFSLELRIKRRRALDAIMELRSIAHIIDMHQLTKDPERVTGRGRSTASSPKRAMTPFELGRYLDYCSEMLSLVSKIGSVYVQEFPDPVAIEAVDRLAAMTADLSRNIWQKIMILETVVGGPTDGAPQPRPVDLSASIPPSKPAEPAPAKSGGADGTTRL